jgi:ElaB/YqjD/DUF883 family membrane-anchored ribosome-binding protein
MDNVSREAERKINESSDRIKDAADRTRRQAVEAVDKAIPAGEQILENIKTSGERYWRQAKAKGQDLLEDVSDKTLAKWGNFKGYVKSKPAQTIAVALLAGVVIGLLVAPKNESKQSK